MGGRRTIIIYSPEHNVTPTKIETIQAVGPVPSLKCSISFSNNTPNEYVTPSAENKIFEIVKLKILKIFSPRENNRIIENRKKIENR